VTRFVSIAGLLIGCLFLLGFVSAQEPKGKGNAPATALEEHVPAAPGEEAGEHGVHDETNLTEGNASPSLPSPADMRFDLAIYTFVVFLILLAILYKFAWGPIARGLDQREETIARQIEEARLASEKAAHQLQEYEARLAAATEEARQIVGQSRKDAETAKDKIMGEARELAQKERERAVADITTAKNQALAEIAQKSVSTAVSLAGKIIRREVKPQDHEQLIGEALGQFTKLN
jgi:F-type H+-transporting ATPase subunit b